MECIETAKEIGLKNILYLTDFSEPADAALPFATAIAREYGSRIHAFHIILPDVYTCMAPEFGDVVASGLEEAAGAKMQRLESRLAGVPHDTGIEWGANVWDALQRVVREK